MNEQKLHRYWKIFQTTNELLYDRGYDILIAGNNIANFDDFRREFAIDGDIVDNQTMNFVKQNSQTKKLMIVYFSNDESIGIKHITKIYEKMMIGKIQQCILIYPNTLTSSAKKYLEKTQKVTIESFSEDDLIINITKHKMTPKHTVLQLEQIRELYSQSGLVDSQLPRIAVTDPIAKYYGMKRGDIVQITRKSETAGLYVTYRICN